jgi:hypothetical protein
MNGDVRPAPSSHQETTPTQSQPSDSGHWSVTAIQRLANISRPNFALGTALLLFALLVLIVLLPDASSRALPIFIAIGSVVVLLGIALASFWSGTEAEPEEPSVLAVSVYLALLLLLTTLIVTLVLGDLDPLL